MPHTTVPSTTAPRAVEGATPHGGDPLWPVHVPVHELAVPKSGRVGVPQRGTVPLTVFGPDGQELGWVTASVGLLGGDGLAASTLTAYAKSLLRAFRPAWALGIDPQGMSGLEYVAVRRWIQHCLTLPASTPAAGSAVRRLSPASAQQTEAALHSVYEAAHRLGLVAENPVLFVREGPPSLDVDHRSRFDTHPSRRGRGRSRLIARVPQQVVVTLSLEQRDQLRDAPHPRDRALWTLLLDSGPRISEALSITGATYLPHEHRAYVVGKGLGGSRRVIPICDTTIEAINDYREWLAGVGITVKGDQSLFRSVKAPYPALTYNAAWKALRRALGDPLIHPHALRHTAATELLDLMRDAPGGGLLRIQQTLGHTHLNTTRRYLHQDVTEVITAHLHARSRAKPDAPAILADTYGEHEIALLAAIRNERPHTP